MGRRGENIRKRVDGRWEARIVKGRPVNGKTNYKYLYGKTYEEMVSKKAEFLCMLTIQRDSCREEAAARVPFSVCGNSAQAGERNPENAKGSRKTGSENYEGAKESRINVPNFEDAARKWLVAKKSVLRESSYSYYAFMVEGHLLPELGALLVTEITTEKLSSFLLGQKEHGGLQEGKGLKDKTVSDLRSILVQILTFAVTCGMLESAPLCPSVTARQAPVSVLTKAEQQKVESVIRKENTPFSLGVLLSLYGGPRIGEVCALKWKDFDFQNGTVRISKTVSRIRNMEKLENARTKVVITPPKTECSARTIPLPTPIYNYFQSRKGAGETYVMTGTEKFMEPRVCLNRYKNLLMRAGVADHSYHCLRHTFATRCIESGVDVKSLSEIMGHSDVKITLQRYVHPSLDFKKEQINKLSCFQEEGAGSEQEK